MKKTLILLTAVCCLFACGKKDGAQEKDSLILAHGGPHDTLDPAYMGDDISARIIGNIYDGLLTLKTDNIYELEPLLAEAMPTVSEDGKTYTFKIKKGVKFHNGYDLTAEDVRYSLLRFILTDPAAGPAREMLEPLLGIISTRDDAGEILPVVETAFERVRADGDTLTVELPEPFMPFVFRMASVPVVSKKWCAENGEWDGSADTWKQFNGRDKKESFLHEHANGSGAYKLENLDAASRRVTLSANEDYFLGAPHIKTARIITVPDSATMRMMLETGDIDIAKIIPQFVSQLKDSKTTDVFTGGPFMVIDPIMYFTNNINASGGQDLGSGRLDGKGITPDFFSDINVRKAFAHSFDYESFFNDSLEGVGMRAGGALPPGRIGFDENLPRYDFDLKKAEEYFKKAWDGKVWENGFYFVVSYNSGNDVRQIAAEMLKRNVESLNPKFKIDVRGLVWPMFLEKANAGKAPLFFMGVAAGGVDPHDSFTFLMRSDGPMAAAQNLKNPKNDALISRALRETDAAKRAELYRELQIIDYEECWRIYISYRQDLWAKGKNIKGFHSVFGQIPLRLIYKE